MENLSRIADTRILIQPSNSLNGLLNNKSLNPKLLSDKRPIESLLPRFNQNEINFLRKLSINRQKEIREDELEPDIIKNKFSNYFQTTDGKRIKKLNKSMTLNDLILLNHSLAEKRKTDLEFNVYLHETIIGSGLNLPKNVIVERNPELEARCVRLRREQEDYKYNQMTKNVDSIRRQLPDDTIAYQLKQINRQLIAVAQFIFSVLAGFAFGFIGVELLIGNLDFGFRLLLGIACSLIIALAEIYFLAKKLNEDLDAAESIMDKKKK